MHIISLEMKLLAALLISLTLVACHATHADDQSSNSTITSAKDLQNEKLKDYDFLDCMYGDSYFPRPQVDKVKAVLLDFCGKMESEKPKDLKAVYALSQHATNEINDLQADFFAHDSEIETGARECIAENFEVIAKAYGFEADIEEMISTREW